MAKAYERYLACLNDGLSHSDAVAEAAWLYDLPVKDVEEYVKYWNQFS